MRLLMANYGRSEFENEPQVGSHSIASRTTKLILSSIISVIKEFDSIIKRYFHENIFYLVQVR